MYKFLLKYGQAAYGESLNLLTQPMLSYDTDGFGEFADFVPSYKNNW